MEKAGNRAAVGAATVVLAAALIIVLIIDDGPGLRCSFPDDFEPSTNEKVAQPGAVEGTVPLAETLITGVWSRDDPSDETGETAIQRVVIVDTEGLEKDSVLARGAGPTISPDRRRIIYLVTRGELRIPWIVNVNGTNPHPFLPVTNEDCRSSTRISWNAAGTLVSMVCLTEAEEERPFIYVFNEAGQLQSRLDPIGTPDKLGATTWVGDDTIIYAEKPDENSQGTNLWMFQPVESESEPVQLTYDENEGHIINPDWSSEKQTLLFSRRATLDDETGAIWSCTPDSSPQQWGSEDSFLAPAWSPDGEKIAFLENLDGVQTMYWSLFDDVVTGAGG